MEFAPKERVVITPIAGLEQENDLSVRGGGALAATPELSASILGVPGLRLEHLKMSSRPAHEILYASAFSPVDAETINCAPQALRGELEHVRLYRIILEKYHMLFEFYNSRSNLLASLQPAHYDRMSFKVVCNNSIYYARYKWSNQKMRMVTTLKIKAADKPFCYNQPLYVRLDADEE